MNELPKYDLSLFPHFMKKFSHMHNPFKNDIHIIFPYILGGCVVTMVGCNNAIVGYYKVATGCNHVSSSNSLMTDISHQLVAPIMLLMSVVATISVAAIVL